MLSRLEVIAEARATTNVAREADGKWLRGQSGNPSGRAKGPVDIGALARVHGPRCIEVAVALLKDRDARIRLAALNTLLDRGFGRPAQTVHATGEGASSPLLLHLLAAQLISDELHAQPTQAPVINATAEQQPTRNLLDAPPPSE